MRNNIDNALAILDLSRTTKRVVFRLCSLAVLAHRGLTGFSSALELTGGALMDKSIRRFLCFLLVLQLIIPYSTFAAAVGEFSAVVGDVTQTRAREVITPIVKSPVEMKDLIVTARSASATMVFSDDSKIMLSENTKLEIREFLFKEKSRTGIFSLAIGKVTANIKKYIGGDNVFEVRAPTGIVGVRGTGFEFIEAVNVQSQGVATISCTEGSLDLSALGPKGEVVSRAVLEAGQIAVIIGGVITVSAIGAAAATAAIAKATETGAAGTMGGAGTGTGGATAVGGGATTATAAGSGTTVAAGGVAGTTAAATTGLSTSAIVAGIAIGGAAVVGGAVAAGGGGGGGSNTASGGGSTTGGGTTGGGGSTVGFQISVKANPATIAAGQSSLITATVTNASGDFVAGQRVSFAFVENNSGASLSLSSGITDANGQAFVVYSAGGNSLGSVLSDTISAGIITGSVGVVVITRM